METALRVLIIEDNETDAALVLRHITRSGFQITSLRVETRLQMQDALKNETWDLIISDFSLPQFDASGALKVLQETGLDIPFIVVSGNIGEETAVALMKAGADDYLMKDKLTRLVPAIQRELADAKGRREQRKAEMLLRESEIKYRKIFENIQDVFYQVDASGILTDISPSIIRYSGYSREELIGRQVEELYFNPDDRKIIHKFLHENVDVFDYDVRLKSKTGEIKWASLNAHLVVDENGTPAGIEGSLRDVSQRRQTESALKISETKFRAIFENSVDAIGVSLNGIHVFVNPAYVSLFGYANQEELLQKSIIECIATGERQKILEFVRLRSNQQKAPTHYQTRGFRKDGCEFDMDVNVSMYEQDGEFYTLVIIRDITAHKKAEDALSLKEQQLSTLINTTTDIICFKDGEGRWLQANSADLELFKLTGVDYYNKKDSELAAFTDPLYRQAFLTCEDSDEKTWQAGKLSICDEIIPTVEGEERIFSVAKTPVFNTDGSRKGLVVFAKDITEHKRIEDEVRESRQQLMDIIDFLPDATFVIDNDKKVIAWNKAMEEMTGVKKEDMIGQGDHAYTVPFYGDRRLQLLDLIDLDDENLKSRYKNVHRVGNVLIGEIFAPELFGGKGAYIWNTGAPLFDTNGNRLGSIESIRDITERKHTEEALKENEEKYRLMVELMPDAVIVHQEGKIVFVNPAALVIVGASAFDQIIGKKVFDFVHPDYRDLASERLRNIGQTGKTAGHIYEKFLKLDGEPIDVDVVSFPVSYLGKAAFQTIVRDITEQKHAEETIIHAEKRFRAIIENAPDGVVLIDFNGKMKFASPSVKHLFGYDPRDIDFIDPASNTHPDDLPQVLAALNDLIQHPSQVMTIEYRFRHKDGSWRWIESIFSNLYADPSVEAIIINFRDITDRKNAEENLRKLSKATEQSPASIVITNPNGEIEYVNKKFTQVTGYTFEEAIGNNPRILKSGYTTAGEYEELWRKIGAGNEWYGEFKNKKKNGEFFYESAVISPITSEKGVITHFIAVKSDITERKLTEKALEQSEERFRHISSSISDISYSCVEIDGKFILDWMIGASEQILGYSNAELLLMKCWGILVVEEDFNLFKEHILNILPGESDSCQLRLKHKNGSIVWVIATAECVIKQEDIPRNFLFGGIVDITESKQAEDAIHQERLLLRTLIDNIPDTIYVKDAQGRKLIANKADMEIIGCSTEAEIIGKTDLEIFGDEIGQRGYYDDMGVIQNNKPIINREENFSDFQGKQRWLLTSKIPLIDKQGQAYGLVGLGHDITERKQAEQIQQVLYNISEAVISTSRLEELIEIIRAQLGTLLDTKNFFIALYDEKTGLLSSPLTNDEKDNISSWPAEKSLTGYVIKHNKSLLVTKAKKEEMKLAGEIELIGTPSEIWLGVPLHQDGKIIGAFAVQSYDNPDAYNEKDVEMLEFVSDQISISIQRKKAEEDIKFALIKAEESDKLKTSFLNNMSHEIRTPLNGIMGFSDMLDQEDITNEERQYFIRIIHQNGNQLTSIIEAIINIASIEAGLEEIREMKINVNTLLSEFFNHYTNFTSPKSVMLNFKTDLNQNQANIISDEVKLRQILNNLIGNAVKFTDSGKIEFGCTLKPVVSASSNTALVNQDTGVVEQSQNMELEFFISDTGIGIDAEYHKVVFERFRKFNPDKKREYGGNGLGLTISKAYIELLGGKIWLNSERGKGSTFYFTLPYKPVHPRFIKEIPQALATPEVRRSKTLLVAEDEYSNYQLLEAILQRENHRIIHVLNGKEAVDAFHKYPEIEMILMDLKMPVMDGITATKIIKSEKPGLPIIAVTAYALSGDKEKALDAGCDEYIAKPIKKSDLLALINKY